MQTCMNSSFLEEIFMEKPIVLVIMDGVGKGDGGSGDAVAVAMFLPGVPSIVADRESS